VWPVPVTKGCNVRCCPYVHNGMISRIGLRSLAVCGWLAALGCSDAPRVRGVVMLTRWQVREPAASVDVYALPARNEIDRELAELCANDSLLIAIGGLEMPIGPVRIQGDGIELVASLQRSRSDERPDSATPVKLTPWARLDVYRAFHARMDSLLRRRAIASARTNETGLYQMPLLRRDSIELFAFTIFDDRGSLLIWRARVPGDGTHDLPKPSRHMNHVYCGEP
jgi:hypothetical protein